MLSDVIDTAGEISVLIKFSPKREKLLENLKEQIKNCEQITPNKITKLSIIRWTVLTIIENYSYIMELWNECLVNENLTAEIKSRVIGCQIQMGKFDLFFGLRLGHRLYSHTDNLSKSLQSKKMSAASSKRLANLTISLLQSVRVEEFCFEQNERTAFISEPKLLCKRRARDYSIINYFSSSSNEESNAYHPNTPRDYYRVIYYEALDSLITSLKERFNQPCVKAFENLESLLPKSLSNESIANEIEYVKCVYKGDLDVDKLVVELKTLKAICQNENFICSEVVRQHMQNHHTKDFILIPNVINVIKLVAVNPATSATAGTAFSLARNLNTWLRSTMLPAIFNSLALLKFQRN